MKRLAAILLSAVFLMGAMTACKKEEEPRRDEERKEQVQEEETRPVEVKPQIDDEEKEDEFTVEIDKDSLIKGLDIPVVGESVNVLIMGIDIEAKCPDAIMICQINSEDGYMNFLSIPRDTRVQLRSYNVKINRVFAQGGVETMISSVKSIADIPIHHYFLINMQAFADIIDELGGVNFTVPYDMVYEDPLQDLYIDVRKGAQTLDGEKALDIVRYRLYATGDLGRIDVQHDLISAVLKQKLNNSVLTKIPAIYDVIENNSSTDMVMSEMLSLGRAAVGVGSSNVREYTLPGNTSTIGEESYYIYDRAATDDLLEDYFGK